MYQITIKTEAGRVIKAKSTMTSKGIACTSPLLTFVKYIYSEINKKILKDDELCLFQHTQMESFANHTPFLFEQAHALNLQGFLYHTRNTHNLRLCLQNLIRRCIFIHACAQMHGHTPLPLRLTLTMTSSHKKGMLFL